MKKLACLFLSLLLLFPSLYAFSEETVSKLNKEVLEGSALYHYDRFSEKWSVYGRYSKLYSDAEIQIFICLWDAYAYAGPQLQVTFLDKEDEYYNKVTAFRAIIGNKKYFFENLLVSTDNVGYCYACSVLKEFCIDLLNAQDKEIAFQFGYTDKFGKNFNLTIDSVVYEDLNELIVIAQLMDDSNAWPTLENLEIADGLYSAYVK